MIRTWAGGGAWSTATLRAANGAAVADVDAITASCVPFDVVPASGGWPSVPL